MTWNDDILNVVDLSSKTYSLKEVSAFVFLLFQGLRTVKDVQGMILIEENESLKTEEDRLEEQSAVTLQSAYRGYAARKKQV